MLNCRALLPEEQVLECVWSSLGSIIKSWEFGWSVLWAARSAGHSDSNAQILQGCRHRGCLSPRVHIWATTVRWRHPASTVPSFYTATLQMSWVSLGSEEAPFLEQRPFEMIGWFTEMAVASQQHQWSGPFAGRCKSILCPQAVPHTHSNAHPWCSLQQEGSRCPKPPLWQPPHHSLCSVVVLVTLCNYRDKPRNGSWWTWAASQHSV